MLYDVFICHASEDKDFVRPLAETLQSHHVEVWFDEFALSVGDSLREAIDRGLASSRFGIVVLSPSFFQKRWPNRELSGLVARETAEDRLLILPVWHEVSRADVLKFSPPLADLLATSSANGLERVVRDILKKVKPEESPLIIARDFLIERGAPPPLITDEWWLDIVEIKEGQFLYPDLNHDWRWIFPLPYPQGRQGRERGLNIAWTALQLDWAAEAQERKICQLTHPEDVHSFLKRWPGLEECARANPVILALYAPQLTLPGFDGGFETEFDVLMSPDKTSTCDAFRYGKPDTTDRMEPLCGDFIAWRHPTFGNYTPSELSYEFVNAHDSSYSRKVFDGFECLAWLLSNSADWLPNNLREALRRGFRDHVTWWVADLIRVSETDALYRRPRRKFAYTKALTSELLAQCSRASNKVNLTDDPKKILDRFVDYGFFEGYFEERNRIDETRKKSNSS